MANGCGVTCGLFSGNIAVVYAETGRWVGSGRVDLERDDFHNDTPENTIVVSSARCTT